MTSLFANLFRFRKVEPEEELLLEAPIPERGGEREPSFKYATVKTASGQKLKAIAVDVDVKGARVRFIANESLSEMVRLSVNGVCSQKLARVAWRDQKDAGLQFVEEA